MTTIRQTIYPKHRVSPPTHAVERRAGARQALQAISKGRVVVSKRWIDSAQTLPHTPSQSYQRLLEQCRALDTATCLKAAQYMLHVYPRYITHIVILVLCCSVIASMSMIGKLEPTFLSPTQAIQQSTGESVAHTSQPGVLSIAPLPLEPIISQDSIPLAPIISATRPDASSVYDRSHTFVAGETLGSVAAAAGVSVDSLIWANDLQKQQFLVVGQQLRIPRVSGLLYTVGPGESLQSIAQRYNTTPASITLFGLNAILADQTLHPGQSLFIPGGTQPLPEALLARFNNEQALANWAVQTVGVVREAQTNLRSGPGRDYPQLVKLNAGQQIVPIAHHEQWVQVELGDRVGWIHADLLALPADTLTTLPVNDTFDPPPPVWVWPARGVITSPFGIRWGVLHNGLDIANAARTPIVAARNGRVVEAGWCSGYGYCVKIDHDQGMRTIYGHMITRPAVSAGQDVEAGQFIGLMGSTYDAKGGGFSTGVHLHFTVEVGGKAINPMKVLP